MKSAHIPTLLELLSQGAKDKPVSVTTTQLAKKLGKSQQLASKHLDEMEKEGLIERMRSGGKTYVKLTKKGITAGASLYSELKVAFSGEEEKVEVMGAVFSGLGEGAYYVSLNGYKRQFISKLGFEPFPGTLNLRLSSAVDRKIRNELSFAKGVHIDGFQDGKRTFGGAECFRALLNGKIEAAVLVIERTSHDDSVLEVISPANVRKQLRLSDGDPIKVTIYMQRKS
jgi:riboflavin kinase, archaea type